MIRSAWIAIVICIPYVTASSVFATPTVTVTPSDGGTASVEFDSGDAEWDITLTRAVGFGGDVSFLVTAPDTDPIDMVTVVSGSGGNTNVYIRGTSPGTGVDSVDTVEDIGTGVANLIELRTINDLGEPGSSNPAIKMDSINTVVVGDDVLNDIVTTNGAITDMFVGGEFQGDVDVNGSNIEKLEVIGRIGTPSVPVTIDVERNIKRIVAGEIYADISTGASFDTQYIETTGAGALDGHFVGSLTTRILSDLGGPDRGLDIAGDLDADLTFTDRVTRPITVAGGFLAARIIKIAGRLADTGDISIGSAGLHGRILINTDNIDEDWLGDVTVGATTLSTVPYYDQTPSSIGGGAVGLVPYSFHPEACVSAHDATVTSIPTKFTVRH
ncbi:MAG: hypothetical protein H6811_08580 [Phycisphaeraceae bacterium]|nr:hypothetical protein [Phycisphaeraceae bacterium]